MQDLIRAVRKAASQAMLAKDVLKDAGFQAAKTAQDVLDAREARQVAADTATQVQALSTQGIAAVVTRCLGAVFGEEYVFEVRFVRKAGRTEAELVFIQGGEEIDKLNGLPGGVVDVSAFALRLACIIMSPGLRRLVVLDEPFQRINGAKYRRRVAQLLEDLAEELDFQFIIVTGTEEYRVGTVIDL